LLDYKQVSPALRSGRGEGWLDEIAEKESGNVAAAGGLGGGGGSGLAVKGMSASKQQMVLEQFKAGFHECNHALLCCYQLPFQNGTAPARKAGFPPFILRRFP
jgi:hypothetical protein